MAVVRSKRFAGQGADRRAGDAGRRRAPVALVVALALGAALAAPATAGAQDNAPGSEPGPVTVPSTLPATPPDFAVSAGEAINIADRTPTVEDIRRRYTGLQAAPQLQPGEWQIFYNRSDGTGVALVIVSGTTGQVLQTWTGYQVAWQMARGNPGQFGHILNAPYVWIPLSLIFFLGLFDFRRWRRLAHLDLLVLLSFGISHVFFNDANIGLSVPLAYPPLLYLLGRMLWIGFRGRGSGLRPSVPVAWLVVVLTFLIGFRVAINVADSGVIDVGYSGVIGADRITHLDPLYGESAFPSNDPTGDTYGPANYLVYVPFELALPWHGVWDDLPSAHAAAIFFDLACILGLYLLGRRLRPGRAGRDLGAILAFAWAAFPYTDFALQSSSNDALVGALLIWGLVAFSRVGARAILLGLATMVKFVPLLLFPLFATGEEGISARLRAVAGPVRLRLAYFTAVFAAVVALMLVYPAIDPGLSVAYDRTIGSQLGRSSPFSVWGQASWLQPLQTALMVAVAALAAALALVPRRRNLVQICALSAAIVIATEVTLDHWFYLYIPWFFGPLIAASATPFATRRQSARAAERSTPGASKESPAEIFDHALPARPPAGAG